MFRRVTPGRNSPPAYFYRPEELTAPADSRADTLIAAGGIYGNPLAAEAIAARVADEPSSTTLICNGDFHYLDADPEVFGRVAGMVTNYRCTLGNVEYAISSGNPAVGCGCAYPPYQPDQLVANSNEVVERLRAVADQHREHLTALRSLPRWQVVEVGGVRVGVVHGDLNSVAGWELAVENLEPADESARRHTGWFGSPMTPDRLTQLMERAGLHVLCCTHTGLAYAQRFGDRVVINNGMAGLPCFSKRLHGLVTRVSVDQQVPPDSLYGTRTSSVRVDAVPVGYDHAKWYQLFKRMWQPGSAAHRGYIHRILNGPAHTLEQAARAGIELA